MSRPYLTRAASARSTSCSSAAALLVAAPLARGRRVVDPARDARPPDLPPAARRPRRRTPFELFKLRTMVSGAETMGAGLAVDEGDDRITRVGALLRRTSIDELPNLINVLRGEMSLVGPRPTVQVQVDRYTDRQRRRLRRAPGPHRLGAGQRPRVAAVARADRARPLVHRARLAAARPAHPRRCTAAHGGHRPRALPRRDRRLAEPPAAPRGRAPGPCRCSASRNVRIASNTLSFIVGQVERVVPRRRGDLRTACSVVFWNSSMW